jgi:5-methylcytosine-specific restriction endonuclease McrA
MIAAMKRVFSRSDRRRRILNAAVAKTKKGPRGGKMYLCKTCRRAFAGKDVQVDHIDPVVPIGKKGVYMSFDEIADRIYCDPKNLQVLCKPCHKHKSAIEAGERKKCRLH